MTELLSQPFQVFAIDPLTKLVMIIVFYIGPFFFIPMLLQRAGGMLNTLTGALNDRTKGLMDRNRNWRGGLRKKGYEKTLEGKEKGVVKRGVGALARRAHFADQGGLSVRGRGRAEYAEARRKMAMATADKMVQEDGGRSGGDDDAMKLIATKGMTRKKFLEDYASMKQSKALDEAAKAEGLEDQYDEEGNIVSYARDQLSGTRREQVLAQNADQSKRAAQLALGSFEANFGAQVGSGTARVAAFKAAMASNTSFSDANWANDVSTLGADMVNDGLMTSVDAAAAIKSNKMRSERSGVGFSTWMSTIESHAAARRSGGPANLSQATVNNLLDDSINGSEPGAIMGGRHESVRILAPRLHQRMAAAVGGGDADFNSQKFQEDMAAFAAFADVSGQVSPLKNKHFSLQMAKKMKLPGMDREITTRQAMEFVRQGVIPTEFDASGNVTKTVGFDNEVFLQKRKEWAQSGLQQAQAFNNAQAVVAAGGAVQPGPPRIPGQQG